MSFCCGYGDDLVSHDDDWMKRSSMESNGDAMMAASAISIFTCALVVISVIMLPQLWKNCYVQVQFYIAFSDLLCACGGVFGNAKDKTVACYWQGVVTNIFPGMSLFIISFSQQITAFPYLSRLRILDCSCFLYDVQNNGGRHADSNIFINAYAGLGDFVCDNIYSHDKWLLWRRKRYLIFL